MFSFLLRGIGFLVLAFALVAAVLDLTRSIAASKVLITSFAELWRGFSPASIASAQQVVENVLHSALWNLAISPALSLPSWLVLWLFSMLLLWVGRRRDNPYGRFASR